MQNFKAVIFDMDGLLLDSERLALDAFQDTCNKFSVGDLDHVFKQCVGANSKLGDSILENALQGIMNHREFRAQWNDTYASLTHGKPIPIKAGARYLLEHIQSIGIAMAVATSTPTDTAKAKLRESGLLGFFKIVIGGDQVLYSKPDPEVYLKAASALSIQPINCLALEDSPNGVKSAMAAKMTVIQIPDLIEPDEELLKMGHIVLNSLLDVPEFNFQF